MTGWKDEKSDMQRLPSSAVDSQGHFLAHEADASPPFDRPASKTAMER